MIYVLWASYHDDVLHQGMWDQGVITHLLDGRVWRTPRWPDFTHVEDCSEIPEGEGAIVVIGARHHVDDVDRLNADLARLPWVLLMLTGDEESAFPWQQLRHPNMRLWVQTPDPVKHALIRHPKSWVFGFGDWWPPHFPDLVREQTYGNVKPFDWVFAGQVTHERRQECALVLRAMLDQSDGNLPPFNGVLYESAGFTQGIPHNEYAAGLRYAKVAPAPSGPVTPDTFRLYEALEAGCVPVVDPGPVGYDKDYWRFLFGDHPIPMVRSWDMFPGVVGHALRTWPASANRVQSWWQAHKRQLAWRLHDDLTILGAPTGQESLASEITVIVTSSPIPSHPDDAILRETVESVRERLPDSEILIAMDGPHPTDDRDAYEEYRRRVLAWKQPNVLPVWIEAHGHQANAVRKAMESVRTPLVLLVEHDTPLVGDIPFWDLATVLLGGEGDLIRLHHEASVLDVHKHLMVGKPEQVLGVPLWRTAQWSQRPHLATTDFYNGMLACFFDEESRVFIEDVMHGIVQHEHTVHGPKAWQQYRMFLYHPEGDIKRSWHTDGRAGASKTSQRFLYPEGRRPEGAPPETQR